MHGVGLIDSFGQERGGGTSVTQTDCRGLSHHLRRRHVKDRKQVFPKVASKRIHREPLGLGGQTFENKDETRKPVSRGGIKYGMKVRAHWQQMGESDEFQAVTVAEYLDHSGASCF